VSPGTATPRLDIAAGATVSIRHGLRTRLLLWTVGLTGLILAVGIAWNYVRGLDRIEAEARHRAAAVAEASADKIDSVLAVLQGLVRGIALTLESQALAIPFEQARALLETTLHSHPQVYGMAIALLPALKPADWRDGAPYAHRGPLGLAYQNLAAQGQSYLGEDWFYLPQHLDQESWSEPYLWSNLVKVVTYSVPIRIPTPGGRRFAGVVTVHIDVGWLDRTIADLPVGKEGYGLLITRNGTYVSHPISALVLNESVFSLAEALHDPSLRAIGQRMVSGQAGLLAWVSPTKNEPSWLAWHPLGTADWTMAAVVSQAELRADIHRLSQQSVLAGLSGIGLLVLAISLVARSITRPIHALGAAAATLASGNLEAALPVPQGRDEVAQLTAAFATMRDSLRQHMADLAATTAARERINGELRIAHGIQMDMLPKIFPPFPERDDIHLFAVMEPAREVGGDFYDFFALDPERLVIAIGDVSDKGVPAALFMAVTRSFLRAAFRADDDPGRALTRVNAELAEGNDSCMFVTLFCGIVRLSDGLVEYANAGHVPPCVVDTQGRVDWIREPYGPAAGVQPGTAYPKGRFRLRPDATLLLYTDGVTEAMDPAHRMFGADALARRLEAHCALDCGACLDALLVDLRAHAAGTEQSDDITMLMLKLTTPSTAMTHETQGAPEPELRLKVANRLPDMASALDQLECFLASRNATPALVYAARLVAEELLTNTIKYGYDDDAEHRISVLFKLGPPATMRIEDDGHPFDPAAHNPTFDLAAPAESRPAGGLGLHLVRSQTASLEYHRLDGINRLDIVFRERDNQSAGGTPRVARPQ